MKTYKVKAPHIGDKEYNIGDDRDVTATDAKHLIGLGLIEDPDADGDDSEAAEDPRYRHLEDMLRDMSKALENERTVIAGLHTDILDRDGKIEAALRDVDRLNADVADRDGQIESGKTEIADLKAQIAALASKAEGGAPDNKAEGAAPSNKAAK